jgi:hypothetical protein
MLHFPAWGAPFDKFRFVSSPPGVVNAKRLFQQVQVKFAEVFFSLVAVPTDFLLLHVTAHYRGRPNPFQLLQLDQVLRQHSLDLIKCFHVFVLPLVKAGEMQKVLLMDTSTSTFTPGPYAH